MSRTSPFRATFWRLSAARISEASVANGPRLPSASFTSWPRPEIAPATFSCQRWKASLVSSSSALKISSIWVAFRVCDTASSPPSSIGSIASASASVALLEAPSATGGAPALSTSSGSVPDVSST